jgi:ubiquinone/menaquinone biosynthesis C-methylase UbiE
VEYGRRYRPHIKFVEAGAENIPLPDEHFDRVVASGSFHHFSDQDRGLEEMNRVLKSNGKKIIMEIDHAGRGKRQKICEGILHTGAKFYEPLQLKKKVKTMVSKYCLLNLPFGLFFDWQEGIAFGMTRFYRGRTLEDE